MDIKNEMVFKSESCDVEVVGVISRYITEHKDVRFDI